MPRRKRPAPVLTSFKFTTLPYDIIVIIANMLLPLRCFVLTCRQFYDDFSHLLNNTTLHSKERQWLLYQREVSAPGYFLCHKCMKLCRWDHGLTSSDQLTNPLDLYWWDFDDIKSKDHYGLVSIDGYGLPFSASLVRIVMNYHLRGPSHGLPLQILDVDLQSSLGLPRKRGPVRLNQSWRAKIINNNLYVHTTSVLWHNEGDAKDLMWTMDFEGLRLCSHRFYSEIRELKPRIREGLFVPCENAMTGCSQCMTDFTTSIFRTGDKRSRVIRIDIYHRLGSCRELGKLRDSLYVDKKRMEHLQDSKWVRVRGLTVRRAWIDHEGEGEGMNRDMEQQDWIPKALQPSKSLHRCSKGFGAEAPYWNSRWGMYEG